MSKRSKKGRLGPEKPAPDSTTDMWRILGPAILVLVTLACYWVPITSSQTSILWDAADYYQVVQDYLSQELHAGRIPFWTPYPWAGYPFLADPQVGAWYPLNWPFFLIGVTPRVLVAEHWLHALLACFGAYFLALRLVGERRAAVLAGLCYGLSGFFVGHSSHTTMLQCAAWMPWLLLLFDRGMESNALRNTALGGLAAGMMILAGHFQTILYSFLALGLFAAGRVVREPRRWARIMGSALAVPIIGTLISAIATGPGLELAVNSIRSSLEGVKRTEGIMPVKALATLINPDSYGVFSTVYRGPQDITQFYFYAGILLVPLAIAGCWNARLRRTGLWLVIPTIWYAMGQSAGLYLLVARLPGFSSVRAPVNIWFVPALGLALMAAAGLTTVAGKWNLKWLASAVLVVFCVDLFYFQSATNPLAYARISYETLYGSKEDLFRRAVVSGLPPLTRFDAPEHFGSFGPMSHFLDERTEVTYGYGPMPFTRYADYVSAMQANPKLRDGLNVSRWLDMQNGSVRANPTALPRANFPRRLVPVRSAEESRQRLASLDQSTESLVPAGVPVSSQDANGTARVTQFTPGHYRIHYRCATQSLVRVGNSYLAGWTANAGARGLKVFPVDHALIGVVVPAGEGDVDLDYHSTYFVPGAVVTLLTIFGCVVLLRWRRDTAASLASPFLHRPD
ncbi:MAG: hypothetical protein M1436_05835 [Acidobacteria bacterium]|nr:hypothetical protein [Acidobacteriota bacterium]